MFPHGYTEQEVINSIIEEQGVPKEDIIKELLDRHDMLIPHMLEGERYYYKDNDITKRVIYKYDENGNKVADTEATNNKLASGWHKLLVDQKTAYLVGDEVTLSSSDESDITPLLEQLEDLGETLTETVKDASNKGRDWWHPYINSEGEFHFIQIPAEEGVPIYDMSNKKNLIGFIRRYELDDGTVKIELWDKQTVTYYEVTNGGITLDYSNGEAEQPHFQYGNQQRSDGYGWQYKVPFIEIANNDRRVGDIKFYKDFIDAYDNLNSDTTNTLEDIQEIFYVIKGYEGTDVSQAVTNLKRYKGVAVSGGTDGGDVTTVQGEVPVESIHAQLENIKKDMYAFGMGVDSDPEKIGNSPSGVALKNLYSLLDMKASVLETKVRKALTELMWFVCEYLRMSNQGDFDYKSIDFTFNKTILTNEAELVDIIQKSVGIVSQETLLAAHPLVSDVELEKERVAKEREEQEQMINLDQGLEEDE